MRLGQGLGQAPGSLQGRHRGLPLQLLGTGMLPKWPVNPRGAIFQGEIDDRPQTGGALDLHLQAMHRLVARDFQRTGFDLGGVNRREAVTQGLHLVAGAQGLFRACSRASAWGARVSTSTVSMATSVVTAAAAVAGPTITVEAEGKVAAVPDLAMLTVEVETRAPQAEALLQALKQALGPGDQVKTLGYRLSPVYAPKVKSGPLEITGYQAVHRLQVKVQGPARLGAVIDLALKNGASGINGPFWEHSRAEELQRQAAVAALERARRLAEALAQSQGLKIKGVETISTGIRFLPLQGPPRP